MNPHGNIAVVEAAKKHFETFARRKAAVVPTPEHLKLKGFDLALSTVELAAELANMPKRARVAFYRARQKGNPENVALARAKVAAR